MENIFHNISTAIGIVKLDMCLFEKQWIGADISVSIHTQTPFN